jgi:formylmethanofuran dehydrogenase subunit B
MPPSHSSTHDSSGSGRGETRVERDVTCVACGCLCDDLTVTHDGLQVHAISTACPLAERWFLASAASRPAVEIQGHPASFDEGISAAAAILRPSDSPLIYGLSRSSSPGQRAAVALGDWLGATIDTTASLGHASSVMAVQQVGEQTCSLGEVRNRADLVVYWGANPSSSHPRHAERYAIFPAGEFISGPDARRVYVVDPKDRTGADLPGRHLRIDPYGDYEALAALRAMVRGAPLEELAAYGGIPAHELRELAEAMRGCRMGIVFFGYGLSQKGIGHHNVEALLRLVRELNDHTRFYARRLRVVGDVTGADLILAWQTGYPFSVNLGRGYPRYNPGEFSAWRMLERREADACLLVGSEGVARFSDRARDELRRLPVVVLDYPTTNLDFVPTVRFTTARYGVDVPGTAYRMDEVPVPLKGFLPSAHPTDELVLIEILKSLQGG